MVSLVSRDQKVKLDQRAIKDLRDQRVMMVSHLISFLLKKV